MFSKNQVSGLLVEKAYSNIDEFFNEFVKSVGSSLLHKIQYI